MPTSLTMTPQTLLPHFFPLPSPYCHMGMDQLCQPAVLHDKELVPSLWLAAFAALIGTTLTNEHNALLQHPLIPPQFPSRVIAGLQEGKLRTTSLKSSPPGRDGCRCPRL